MGDCWESKATLKGHHWTLADYGDQLPWSKVSQEMIDDLNSTEIEKNQCLIIHLAAGLHLKKITLAGEDRQGLEFPQISTLAGEIRSDMYMQAKDCHDSIGELESEVPLLRAELRSHAHDLCKRNHDKDNRILLCFPPKAIAGVNVCIINVSPSMRFTTPTIPGRSIHRRNGYSSYLTEVI